MTTRVAMIMKPKLLWIIAGMLLITHLIIQFAFFAVNGLDGSQMFFAVEFISSLIAIACTSLVIGAIVAFIPVKQRTYKEKFNITLPLFSSIVLAIWIVAFSYYTYLKKVKGIELKPLIKYENIIIPDGVDCASVHEGLFETDKLSIERFGSKQIQTNKQTGIKSEFTIEWINDCEYYLTSTSDNSNKLRIKIVSVKADLYSCYVISEKYADKYPNFLTIKRLESK